MGSQSLRIFTAALIVFCLSSVANAAKIEIKFGHDQTEQSPHHEASLYLKKLIEEGSNGEISFTIYPNQLLGSGTQMVEMVQLGAVQMVAVPTSRIQAIAPIFQILDLPFLFPTKEELYERLYGEFGTTLFNQLQANNVTGLTYWGMGFKQFTGDFPIHTPADFRGKKIRVMPSPVIREQFRALGASPVPIDFHELYNALQQGVVDGQENPLVGIATMKLYEVQEYMTLSDHAFLAYGLVTNSQFFNSLEPHHQELIKEATAKSAIYQLDLIEQRDQDFLNTIKDAGVTVETLTPQQKADFQEAMLPVYEWFSKNITDGELFLEKMDR